MPWTSRPRLRRSSLALRSRSRVGLYPPLTPTEARVALLLAQALRSEEVALELGVSASTVAFHLRNLFAKTATGRQADLVALVLSAGWALPDLSTVVETRA